MFFIRTGRNGVPVLYFGTAAAMVYAPGVRSVGSSSVPGSTEMYGKARLSVVCLYADGGF